jgi:hypothetical protein
MRSRWLAVGAVAMVLAVLAGAARLVGQAPAPSRDPAGNGRPYIPPRTPWGDPDLQGNFTNKYEQSTPFERPAAFEGRRLEEITGPELAAILSAREREVLGRAAGVGPNQFRDSLDVTRASRAWLVIDPPDGRIPPVTTAARRRLSPPEAPLDVVNARPRSGSSFTNGPFDGPEDLSLFDRCVTRGLPGSMMPFLHGNSYQIVQAPGLVSIRYEIMHEARVIPLDGRPHVGKGVQLDMGDARGRWDGGTLVVETTNFRDRSAYRNANATTLRLVERFTRVAPDRIEWAVTVDDPETWTRPWTFAMPLTRNDHEAVLEFACHEGNYSLANILSAARSAESGKAAANKP